MAGPEPGHGARVTGPEGGLGVKKTDRTRVSLFCGETEGTQNRAARRRGARAWRVLAPLPPDLT